MHISDFISSYRNHPVLFVGTGVSLRYLKESHTWDGLLKRIAFEFQGKKEYYLDLKSQCELDGKYDYTKIASKLELDFNSTLVKDPNGKFEHINNIFYEKMEQGKNLSRLKIYIAEILSSLETKPEMAEEISEFRKVRKNIGSIITTNYDKLIEEVFEFDPLIGNDILLSNPYGSVYKIHGCVSDPLKIIITEKDYGNFSDKYELIRAQLLSIFIHNPIIFLGYNIGDENIKELLKTIFTYIEPNSPAAEQIRKNFLLVEYEAGSASQETGEHDIDLEGFATIRINKIKTDDFTAIYKALANLLLPISAMDVRKVQAIVKEIYAGGEIKVMITEDLDSLNNSDRILAIGSSKSITYQFLTSAETMANYFSVIEEANSQLIELINKYKISSTQFFPIFGFDKIYDKLMLAEKLKDQQVEKLKTALNSFSPICKCDHNTIEKIKNDDTITAGNKVNAIMWAICNQSVNLEDCEAYLRSMERKNDTQYRKLLCAYDYMKYGPGDMTVFS